MSGSQTDDDRAYLLTTRPTDEQGVKLHAMAERLLENAEKLNAELREARATIDKLTTERDVARNVIDMADVKIRCALSWAGRYPAGADELQRSVDAIVEAFSLRQS